MIIVTGQCAMLCRALACMVLLISITSLLENSAAHPKYTQFVAHTFFLGLEKIHMNQNFQQ